MTDDFTPWQRQALRLAAYQLAPDDATAGAMRDLYARFALAFEEWLSEWARETGPVTCAHPVDPPASTGPAMDDIAAAWDEGYKAGKAEAKAMQAGYPETARNPCRKD